MVLTAKKQVIIVHYKETSNLILFLHDHDILPVLSNIESPFLFLFSDSANTDGSNGQKAGNYCAL